MFFDIHSHILPDVDDGAKDISESLELLSMMKAQGITDCLATPHFYPEEDNLRDFISRINSAFLSLSEALQDKDLPNIYLGCEVLYFEGIGNSESIAKLCLNRSDILLLELTDQCINQKLFDDLLAIRQNFGITPMIAHIERYYTAKKYRKFLKFLKKNKIPAQLNASSLLQPAFEKTIKKLIKEGIAFVVATDAHSVELRPPVLDKALAVIEERYGRSCRIKLVRNSQRLYEKIVPEGEYSA